MSQTYHLIFSQVIARRQRLARVLSVQPRLSPEAVEGSPDILSHIEPLLPLRGQLGRGAGDTDRAQGVSEGCLLLVSAT